VTDRGEVVAEFSPPGGGQADASILTGLLALARRGMATIGSSGEAALYKALPRKHPGKRSAAQLLDDERGPR